MDVLVYLTCSFYLSGSGTKTVARVVADVLSALNRPLCSVNWPFTLSVAKLCDIFSKYSTDTQIVRTLLVDAGTFHTYSLDKQEQYRQIIRRQNTKRDEKCETSLKVLVSFSRDSLALVLHTIYSSRHPRV
jgi:hypothetical protein